MCFFDIVLSIINSLQRAHENKYGLILMNKNAVIEVVRLISIDALIKTMKGD